MSEPDKDRRRAKRKILRTTAEISLGDTQSFTVRTLEISATGMGIVASANPKPGTVLRISFAIPAAGGAQVLFDSKACVVQSVFSTTESGFRVGLSFVELPAGSAAAAKQYVA